MPIYEYKCNKCGYVFEQLVLGSDEEGYACPTCGENDTCKLMSSFSSKPSGSNVGTGGLSSSCSSPSGGFS